MKPAFLVLALALLSCGGPAAAPPDIAVSDGWARATTAGKGISAAYLTLANRGGSADSLVGIDASTGLAEVHSSTTEGGVMRMRKLDSLPLPAGATVRLQPGGTHVMLLGLRDPLEPGEQVGLTLRFARSPSQRVQAEVRSLAEIAQ